MSSRLGLGASFDIIPAVTPVDLDDGATTGARLHMENYGAVALCFYRGQGAAGNNPTLTVQEHNANTGGTSQDLDVVTEYYKKEEATLDGDETWTRVTQDAGDITDAEWDDATEALVVAHVRADQLSDGFEWISVNTDDPGAGAHLACIFYVAYDLKVQRAPANLANPNA